MRIFLDGLAWFPHVSVGSQAMILGAMNIIERRFPGTEYVFISSNPAAEAWYLKQGDFNISIRQRSPNQLLKALQMRSIVHEVDAVVAVWGDAYVTIAPHNLWRKAFFLKRRGVPLVMFTASIGPFVPGWRSWLARRGLSYFDALTIREPNTLRFVHSLGLTHAKVYPDTAFAWPACQDDLAREILRQEGVPDAPSVGLNISILLHHIFIERKLPKGYEDTMCGLIEHLRSLTGLQVLLLPHQFYYPGFEAPQHVLKSRDGDDRIACEWVFERLQDKSGVYMLKGAYGAAEYKGIIKQCEIFIGGRMHSVVGAVSTETPSLVMQYSHKAGGLMRMIGMEDYVWDIKTGLEECKTHVSQLWQSRRTVRKHLSRVIPCQIEGVFSLGDVLADAFRQSPIQGK